MDTSKEDMDKGEDPVGILLGMKKRKREDGEADGNGGESQLEGEEVELIKRYSTSREGGLQITDDGAGMVDSFELE
jgi:hypothetical protein